MVQGFRIAASGAMVALHRTDVLAANLANVNTIGFKPDSAAARARDVVRVEDGVGFLPSDPLLERLGAGVIAGPPRVSFAQGPLQRTGNDLDVALEGEGFLAVRSTTSSEGELLRLTRDGRLTRDDRGLLVQAASGLPVVNAAGQPIALPEGKIVVDGDGTIRDPGGGVIDRLRLVGVPNTAVLRKLGESLYSAPPEVIDGQVPPPARVRQGMLEGSAVDPVRAMMDVTNAGRSVSGNARMIGYHDQILDQAINTFARVS
ncbi:MAG: flagellar hook basal-body protein [Planctomycetota bacterium]